ncbi:nitrogen regulation protein NR(I) [Dasania sp. GY-MA-18]|uniref:DNA-binding transcriptional regulator NtrC n=1 Tax=Dasania phycosphaerae TaxID=2950436 RepID=A0A9J6RLV3_9GAMM|nr:MULTISPECIES: nitrogen regulation protein NR(I) [Dasania]MCR8923059.1 nitrogen regulation protein NR(I) [Dasania sp. GY-MA-18]MCZ0865491.1 nitrogen regulation protein NR(I) [Dasania phycosphaerae]MCZ0869216.1 nitrogen regulation protein NR(I) [Dasania phycosphaerae]
MIADGTVWIVDDDRSIRWVLEKALNQANINSQSFSCAEDLLQQLSQQQPQAIISDIRMPGLDGIALLDQLSNSHPHLPIIITTAHSDLDSAVSSYQSGAFEYLPKPFDVDDVVAVTQRALQHAQQHNQPLAAPKQNSAGKIIGAAPAMQEVFRAIGRLSQSNITVLINGESGTGKELVAHALHAHSPRAQQSFIALNMAAIPKDLMESELFGHEKGAFTGANNLRQGRFEQANNGTLFLDEIGDMPADTQTRLLRVLADGIFYRVGGHTPIQVNVRIIAATHQNLEQLVAEGKFREDLFHRLNVIRIHLPRLSERREDLPQLIKHFLQQAAKELDSDVKTLTPQAEALLCSLDWPGNVRQLENTCRWITVMAASNEIQVNDLPPELTSKQNNKLNNSNNDNWQQSLSHWVQQQLAAGQQDILKKAMPEFETLMINAALQHTHGKKQEAAKLLGWGRNTLTRKLHELDIS